MISNRTIAICDILGFRKLVADNPLNDVVQNALGFFRKTLHHSIHQDSFPEDSPSLKQLKNESRVGMAWFSDTVLFYSLGDTDEDCRRVIESTAWLLFETMSFPHTRVRAAVSYGAVFVDDENGIFVGYPIIEAYELQHLQNWSGGALAPSIESRIPQHILSEQPLHWYFTDYPVPLKDLDRKFTDVHLAIDWTRGIHDFQPFPWSKKSAEPTTEDKNKSPDVVAKWNNTRDFHSAKCRFCGRRQRQPAPEHE
ncbi:MAG: hypothetical protein WBW16_07235 [Bacteroidota bacterium]